LATPSSNVLRAAEGIGQTILDINIQPDKTFFELREMVLSNSVEIFREFSEGCPAKFDTLRAAVLSGRRFGRSESLSDT
jgi:hypothetical protein